MIGFIDRILRKKNTKGLKKTGCNPDIDRSVRFKNKQYISIGDNVMITRNGRVEAWDQYNDVTYTPSITIGDNTLINENCHIGCIDRVTIGNDCLFGSNVMITDHSHGANRPDEINVHPAHRNLYSKGPVTIGNKVWLCENVVVLPGVTVGDNSVIGANSVVTKNIPSNSVAVGNPARVVKTVDEADK